MNKLEQQLSKVVEKALQLAEQTGEFAIEQAPLLLKEFYTWHIIKYASACLLGVLLMVLGRYIINLWTVKYNPEEHKKNYERTVLFGRFGEHLSMYMPFIILNAVGLTVLIINIYPILFVLSAPKLYLIEYFLK